ncbi:MAG: glycosyltransferase [Chloroflexi bacterium]|nr:glycosyltransferase [Chloroflexota bacterium]
MPRDSLLYLTPVVPCLTGNGLAMRAGAVLHALAERFELSLHVAGLYPPFVPVPDELARLCRRISVTRPGLQPSASETPFVGESFAVLHVFRLATLPVAYSLLASVAVRKRHLDLDDVESRTGRRLAELYRLSGLVAEAESASRDADRAGALEAEVLRSFDRVYVCSDADRQLLRGRSTAELCVLPNALPAPDRRQRRPESGVFTLLFVGTMGYYPNEDAVRFFCDQVLPILRLVAPCPFEVAVVGGGASPRLQSHSVQPEVRLVGRVGSVAPWYERAGAAIVPVRAGGGTRIKIIEAFAHRRPVVATTVGAEGIAAVPGEHFLVGDSPAAFAAQCARLMADADLRERLTSQAYELFKDRYSWQALSRVMAKLF